MAESSRSDELILTGFISIDGVFLLHIARYLYCWISRKAPIINLRCNGEDQIQDVLRSINQRSGLLRGLKSLRTDEQKLDAINNHCRESYEKFYKKFSLHDVHPTSDMASSKRLLTKYECRYEDKLFRYFEKMLNVELCDEDDRQRELTDVLLYFLLKGDQPDTRVQNIIKRIWDPADGIEHRNRHYMQTKEPESWLDLCCRMFFDEKVYDEKIFPHLLDRIGGKQEILQFAINQNPQLLFTLWGDVLVYELSNKLSHEQLHRLLFTIRNDKQQTLAHININPQHQLWYRRWIDLPLDENYNVEVRGRYSKLYDNYLDDLYDLLSVKDIDGKTALHENIVDFITVIGETYAPKYRDKLLKLLEICDNKDYAPIDIARGQNSEQSNELYKCSEQLVKLYGHAQENQYLVGYRATWHHAPSIIIIYNTNNRSDAEKEANSIRKAFQIYSCFTKMEKNLNKDETIEIIKRTANKPNGPNRSYAYLLVVMMSHGNVGSIADCNGEPIPLSAIENAMCDCESSVLREKPKILVTQCCQIPQNPPLQGSNHSVNGDIPYAPTHPHFAAIQSCVEGEQSTRNKFLPKLVEQLEKHKLSAKSQKRTNTIPVLVPVHKLVEQVCRELMKDEDVTQNPIILSTLQAELCLI